VLNDIPALSLLAPTDSVDSAATANVTQAGRRGNSTASHQLELRFRALLADGCEYAFPCNAGGHVDLDALGARARNDYFRARTLVGRDFAAPTVQPRIPL